jgi:uncharacterized protein YkwD
VAALATAAVGVVVSPAVAQVPSATRAERALVQLINQARAKEGLRPLRLCKPLSQAARAHSVEMIQRRYFAHRSISGESQAARVVRFGYRRAGYTSWSTGETLGFASGSAGSPRGMLGLWLRSPAHRALLLGRAWRDIGVGCATGTFRGCSNVTVWTVDLGRRSQ